MKKGVFLVFLAGLALFLSFRSERRINLDRLQVLPLSEVKADGWIRNLIVRDMHEGYFSILEQVQPSLQQGVFGPNKVTNFRIDKNGDYTIRKETWWWGEHEGYWADLVIRNAYITGDQRLLLKADSIVKTVLANQDTDGYIGIYKKGHRLKDLKGEDGELWSQSRILGALVAYYEYTGKKEVLDAVVKAAKLTMSTYGAGEGQKSYFNIRGNSGGGTAHGLMFIEVMEMLHRHTGDKAYADFAFWLYEDYSKSKFTNNKDNQLSRLLDKELLFDEHGVHVVEHNRVVYWLSTLTDDPRYKTAFENIFYKLSKSTMPSGAIVSDEMVHKQPGDPNLFYEYCTLTERLISTFSAIQKTGRLHYADNIEDLVFNAGMGARFPDMKATAYCTKDNRKEAVPEHGNFRHRFSANNSPLCCNLNAGKLLPYYISNLWMKTADGEGLVVPAYGPSQLSTTVKGAKVSIREVTAYPLENRVTFVLTTSKKKSFPIVLRQPGWATGMTIKAGKADVTKQGDYYVVTKKWNSGDEIVVEFDSETKAQQAVNGETYLRKGPLLFALPVPEVRDIVKTFRPGFHTFDMTPVDKPRAEQVFSQYKLVADAPARLELTRNPAANPAFPWDTPYYFLKAGFEVDGQVRTETLYPLGSTLLRKLTFPAKGAESSTSQAQ